jgi:SAM-dependent methyltransferase
MASVPHGSARTTPRLRAEFQASKESSRALAARYGLNAKTVRKWRKRTTTADALTALEPEDQRLTPEHLGALDQFHTRGLAATTELAKLGGITGDMSVLDVGSGVGGPARFLAATYGCRVTGVDLSQPFVDAARYLTARTGQSGQVSFQTASALALGSMPAFASQWWQEYADWAGTQYQYTTCKLAISAAQSPAVAFEVLSGMTDAKLVDKGDEVDVVSNMGVNPYFRTKEACERVRAATEEKFQRSLDPYR